jgi:hypothetical protein
MQLFPVVRSYRRALPKKTRVLEGGKSGNSSFIVICIDQQWIGSRALAEFGGSTEGGLKEDAARATARLLGLGID